MSDDSDRVLQQLGELAALQHQTQETEKRILTQALTLADATRKRMDDLRAGANAGQADAMADYEAAARDLGQLQTIIETSRRVLGHKT